MSQSVAMKISGHKTTAIYRRYRIVDETDIGEALARTQAAMRAGKPWSCSAKAGNKA